MEVEEEMGILGARFIGIQTFGISGGKIKILFWGKIGRRLKSRLSLNFFLVVSKSIVPFWNEGGGGKLKCDKKVVFFTISGAGKKRTGLAPRPH